MNKYILNGERMRSRAGAHDEIALALSLPAHYGRNLDALWDMIYPMEADVTLVNASAMLEALGDYGKNLLETLLEANEKTRSFRFRIEE